MADVTPDQAADALRTIDSARRHVTAEIGLPRTYWWALATAWLILGILADFAPAWATTVATVAFALGHSIVASRLLDGRRRSHGLRVDRGLASRRIPALMVGILLGFVVVTIGLAVALQLDGVHHPATWAGGLVAVIVGFAGPEILAVTRLWAHA
ncbi:hypothetical protein [Gordonia soli]|uniref:Uncharacterized protein n=1 Tax=Gordonia soli NBRC 108243 TaxID=1223545 RepID=M0QLR1_9ACTN|nr:hypothetical protein [Gordonia soli]GAC69605.1 hypothetical protein GS4_26_00530 [Gordonia soli NBRC 108243]